MNPDRDHRFGYSLERLYYVGFRMVGDWDEEATIETYMELHPEADEAWVRAEVERFAAGPEGPST